MNSAGSRAGRGRVEREQQQDADTQELADLKEQLRLELKKLQDAQQLAEKQKTAMEQKAAEQERAAQQLQAQLEGQLRTQLETQQVAQLQLNAPQGHLQEHERQAAPCAPQTAQLQPVAQLAPWASAYQQQLPPAHTMPAPPPSQAPLTHQLQAEPFFGGLAQQLPPTAHQAWNAAHPLALSRPPLASQPINLPQVEMALELLLAKQELKRKAEQLEHLSSRGDVRSIMFTLGGHGYPSHFG